MVLESRPLPSSLIVIVTLSVCWLADMVIVATGSLPDAILCSLLSIP